MTKSNRLATALTAASLLAIVTACAGPNTSPRSASIFGDKVDTANIGLATRAQMALASNEISTAISLAERAVENSPRDAGFRALLGNCYLAAGRFASAEAAYKDSLTLVASQPQVVLKLALVEIAQGKNDEAKYLLAQAQGMLDSADTGLALALAGDPQSAVAVLEPAARAVGADSRTRQNLALAYALAGQWEQAKVVAAQDVPGDQLDARIEQWMVLAKPSKSSDQVAAFIGIQPVASDPGQPVRLALNAADDNVRQAAVEPIGDVPEGLTSTAVRPSVIASAKSTRFESMMGASTPCLERAEAAELVRRVRPARFTTNSQRRRCSSTMSMVGPTARRSTGLGWAGIITRSARCTAAMMMVVKPGGVSMKTSLAPASAACPSTWSSESGVAA